MTLELSKIKRSMHADVIQSFWTMMQELESTAYSDEDPVLQHQVEGWYRQWNRMTGDSKRPRWMADTIKQETDYPDWIEP